MKTNFPIRLHLNRQIVSAYQLFLFNGLIVKMADFEAIDYDPKKHKWDDVSKQALKFESIRFDFDKVQLEVGSNSISNSFLF